MGLFHNWKHFFGGAKWSHRMPLWPKTCPQNPLTSWRKKTYLATHSLAGRVKHVILLFQDFIEPHNRGGLWTAIVWTGEVLLHLCQDFNESWSLSRCTFIRNFCQKVFCLLHIEQNLIAFWSQHYFLAKFFIAYSSEYYSMMVVCLLPLDRNSLHYFWVRTSLYLPQNLVTSWVSVRCILI